MSAAANAAGFLFLREDKRLREWQYAIDNHLLAEPPAEPAQKSPDVRARGPRITYKRLRNRL